MFDFIDFPFQLDVCIGLGAQNLDGFFFVGKAFQVKPNQFGAPGIDSFKLLQPAMYHFFDDFFLNAMNLIRRRERRNFISVVIGVYNSPSQNPRQKSL
jgi:hypothetical protein